MYLVFLILYILCALTCIGVTIAGIWTTFVKAGRPGWAAIIPIYSWIVRLDIAGKPWWWIFLLIFVPFGILIWGIMAMIALANNFGRGTGFGIGLLLVPFVFFPLLGFGDEEYRGR
jgi:Family of unknown function (DUF5684)